MMSGWESIEVINNYAHEKTLWAGTPLRMSGAGGCQRHAIAFGTLWSAERTGWEGEGMDRLRTEHRSDVWRSGALESDSVGGRGVGLDGHVGYAEAHRRVEEIRRGRRGSTSRLGKKLLSYGTSQKVVIVRYLCFCVFFPFILDIKFVGRTSRGHTGGRSHRISHPPSFCGACLNFSREKDSAIPFPRRL